MAASNLNLGKASGGVLNIQPADGTTNTSLVLPAINGTVVAADSNGNVGIGAVPSVIGATKKEIDISTYGSIISRSDIASYMSIGANTTADGIYKTTNVATTYEQTSGNHKWYTAPSGTAGNTITWTNAMTLDNSGNLLLQSGTGGLGYGTGAGGTVTQLTSKSTDVTLNKPSGTIIMNGAALAAGATVTFRFFNSVYTNNYDLIYFQLLNNSNADKYNIWAVNNGSGFAFIIHVKNISASSLSDILTINFALIKGATA